MMQMYHVNDNCLCVKRRLQEQQGMLTCLAAQIAALVHYSVVKYIGPWSCALQA